MRPALLTAYRNTVYRAAGSECRIGRRTDAMDRLLVEHGVRQAVFVTAFNPFSRAMPAGWNRRMQARLAEALRRRRVLPGNGRWRRWSEAHALVFGDPRPIRRMAMRFRQNAVVVVRLRQPIRLAILV